jgi:hypothetical protein
MREMNKVKNAPERMIISALLCLTAAFSSLLSELFILRETLHECPGESCRTCAEIRMRRLNETDEGFIPEAAALTDNEVFRKAEYPVVSPSLEHDTLITNGTRLDC